MPTKLQRREFPCWAFKLVRAIWQATVEHVQRIRRPREAVYLCPLIHRISSLVRSSSSPSSTQLYYYTISGYKTSVRKHWPLSRSFSVFVASNNQKGDLSMGFSILLDSHIVNLDNVEIFNVELWPFQAYFISNVTGKPMNASLCLHFPWEIWCLQRSAL